MSKVEFGNFAGATLYSEFADATCHPELVTATSALGGRGARFTVDTATGARCYGDVAQHRVHMLAFPGSPGAPFDLAVGREVWWPFSIRRRSGSVFGSVTLNEIHANGSPACALQTGPAPFNFQCRDDAGTARWSFILRGAPSCGSGGFIQHHFGAVSTIAAVGTGTAIGDRVGHAWTGLSDVSVADEWLHVLFRVLLSGDRTVGKVQAWACKGVASPTMVEIIPETTIATCYPIANYPILSNYFPNQAGTSDYEYAAGAIFSDAAEARTWQSARLLSSLGADVWTGTPPAPATVTVSIPAAVNDDDHLLERSSTVYANVSGASTVVDSVTTTVEPSRGLYGADYYIGQGVVKFDTATGLVAYPLADYEVVAARFLYNVPSAGSDAESRNVVADWIPVSTWPPTWSDDITGNALDIDLTTVNSVGDGEVDLYVTDDDISRTGYTGLKFGISGGIPSFGNHWRFAAVEHATGRAPTLELDLIERTGTPPETGTESQGMSRFRNGDFGRRMARFS